MKSLLNLCSTFHHGTLPFRTFHSISKKQILTQHNAYTHFPAQNPHKSIYFLEQLSFSPSRGAFSYICRIHNGDMHTSVVIVVILDGASGCRTQCRPATVSISVTWSFVVCVTVVITVIDIITAQLIPMLLRLPASPLYLVDDVVLVLVTATYYSPASTTNDQKSRRSISLLVFTTAANGKHH